MMECIISKIKKENNDTHSHNKIRNNNLSIQFKYKLPIECVILMDFSGKKIITCSYRSYY